VIPREGVERLTYAEDVAGHLIAWVIPREGVESYFVQMIRS
jgi:hypothetical protein